MTRAPHSPYQTPRNTVPQLNAIEIRGSHVKRRKSYPKRLPHLSATRSSSAAHSAQTPFAECKSPATSPVPASTSDAPYIPSIICGLLVPKMLKKVLCFHSSAGMSVIGRAGFSRAFPKHRKDSKPVFMPSASNHVPGVMSEDRARRLGGSAWKYVLLVNRWELAGVSCTIAVSSSECRLIITPILSPCGAGWNTSCVSGKAWLATVIHWVSPFRRRMPDVVGRESAAGAVETLMPGLSIPHSGSWM